MVHSQAYKCRSQIEIKKEWSSSWKRSDAHWQTDDLAAGPCAVPAERGIRCSCLGQNGALLRWLKDYTLIRAHGFNTVTLHRNHTPAAQTILISWTQCAWTCMLARVKKVILPRSNYVHSQIINLSHHFKQRIFESTKAVVLRITKGINKMQLTMHPCIMRTEN